VSDPRRRAGDPVIVGLPDIPERRHMGELPANVELALVPPGEGPVPDLSRVDLVVPTDWMRRPLLDALAAPGRLRVIQTLSAGVDWLAGHVHEGVMVCNARGVYDGPLAEWVIGAILAMQRGLARARDAQALGAWTSFEPDELAGRHVVILGFGSIGTALAERLRPFGVEVIGVARTRRDGALGFEDLDRVLPNAEILVDLLPLTSGRGLPRRRRLRPADEALVVVASCGGRS
jgi:phosphoglycerate dehydrogenase-like enzyme